MPYAGKIYYTEHKNDHQPPLVLVHGAGGSRLDWPGELRRLPGARVLTVDLPGHGKSEPPGRAAIADYARDVVDLLDVLNIQRAVVMGHSMGGAIAQVLALDYTNKISGLVLIGTGAKLSVHPEILNGIRDNPAQVAQMLTDWFWSTDVDEAKKQATFKQIMAAPAETLYNDYSACNQFDVRSRLGEIIVPTLVIGGTADRMTPHKFSEYLQANIPHAQLVTIENGGHMMALEHPQRVADAVHQWFGEHFAAP